MATIHLTRLLLLFVYLQTSLLSFSQSVSFPYHEWVKKLSDQNGPANSGVAEILATVQNKDSSQAITVLKEIEKNGNSSNEYFISRFNLLTATWLYNYKGAAVTERISELMKKALNGAYDTNDDSLISNISWYYGELMYKCKAIEPAAMYCRYAIELAEKAGIQPGKQRLTLLGSILYSTRDYERSIHYTRQAIEKDPDTSTAIKKGELLSRWNTIALCWQKIGNYDSAFYFYKIALQIARQLNNNAWIAIISGNMGQVYYLQGKYDLAKPLLEFDYEESIKNDEIASGANSLQWAARINLAQGKKDSALTQIEKALGHPQIYFEPVYLQNISYAAAEVYRAFNKSDSVIKYSGIYNHLHDSIERAVANSRLEIARIKLENLENSVTIKNLHKEQEDEKLKRNFILAGIFMLVIIAILVLNRQRQKLAYQQKLVLQQQAAAENEMNAAKEQLEIFKQNIIEKTNLIEKLESEVHDKEAAGIQRQVIEELTHLTILTEDDWEKFKTLFEKIYPDFFSKLKHKAPDITLAEQRMAALIKLHLAPKQMASILGISSESVQKSKRRLRQRLQLGDEINLEDSISQL